MPKSKVRKKDGAPVRSSQTSAPTPRALAPSPNWYPAVMATVLLVGLAWLIVFYLTNSGTSPRIAFMATIGAYNYLIGFGVMLIGLVMAVRWR